MCVLCYHHQQTCIIAVLQKEMYALKKKRHLKFFFILQRSLHRIEKVKDPANNVNEIIFTIGQLTTE